MVKSYSKRDKERRFINKGKTKSRNRLLHLMKRFNERHKISVSLLDIEDILKQINSGEAEFIESDPKATVYKVTCRNKEIAVVYDRKRKELVTTYRLQKRHYQMIERRKQKAAAKAAPATKEAVQEVKKQNRVIALLNKIIGFMKGKIKSVIQ